MHNWIGIVLSMTLLIASPGCGDPATPTPAPTSPPTSLERGRQLAHQFLIVDTHVDIPNRLAQKMEDNSVRTPGGDFDEPRAREGGLDAPFMSIYVSAGYQESGGAKEYADKLIEDLTVRKLLNDRLQAAAVSRIQIERPARNAKITIYSARPGVIIGKKGGEIEGLRDEISKMLGVPVHIRIEEIRF